MRRRRQAALAVALTLFPELLKAAPKAAWLGEVGLPGRNAILHAAAKKRRG